MLKPYLKLFGVDAWKEEPDGPVLAVAIELIKYFNSWQPQELLIFSAHPS